VDLLEVDRKFKVSMVNFTQWEQHLQHSQRVKTLFPRWMALGTARNAQNRSLKTSSFVFAGDSKQERDEGIAPGFPNTILGKDEVIALDDLMQILGVNEGDQI